MQVAGVDMPRLQLRIHQPPLWKEGAVVVFHCKHRIITR